MAGIARYFVRINPFKFSFKSNNETSMPKKKTLFKIVGLPKQ